MLSPALVASQRAIANSYMSTDCTVLRKTTTTDATSIKVQSYTQVASNIKCRPQRIIRVPGVDDSEDKLNLLSNWIIVFPVGTDIRATDRVQIQNVSNSSIDEFEIGNVYDDGDDVATIQMYAMKIV